MPLRLNDDGNAVTLDLHGVTVDDAERLIQRTARIAASRGRGRLTVIHGASTSDIRYRNRTIRHALYDLLDSGALEDVTSDFRNEGSCLLGLAAGPSDSRRITLADIRD